MVECKSQEIDDYKRFIEVLEKIYSTAKETIMRKLNLKTKDIIIALLSATFCLTVFLPEFLVSDDIMIRFEQLLLTTIGFYFGHYTTEFKYPNNIIKSKIRDVIALMFIFTFCCSIFLNDFFVSADTFNQLERIINILLGFYFGSYSNQKDK